MAIDASSSYTLENLEALEQAIATGASIVTYSTSAGGTKSVTYRTLSDMLRIRDLMRKALGLASSATSVHPSFSKGLG